MPENSYLDSVVSQLPAPDAPQAPAPGVSGQGQYLDQVVEALPPLNTPNLQDEQRKYDFLRWRIQNEKRAPEEQAEVLRLSSALGWNPEVTAADLPAARGAVEAKNLDAEKVLKAHPALADFIGDPRTTALARGDTARLTGLAYLTGTVGMTSDRPGVPGAVELWFKQRGLARDTHDLQLRLLQGSVPDENASPEIDLSMSGYAAQATRPLTDSEKASLAEQVRKNEAELQKLRTYGDGVEELNGWGPRQLAKTARLLIEMGPEMAKGAAVTAAGSAAGPVGAAAAGTAFWAYETAPGIFWQLSELKDPHTKKPVLSEDEARAYAVAASIPIGLLNAVSLEGLGASLTKWKVSQPFIEKALSILAKSSVDKVLAKKGLTGVLERAALHYGTHALQGGLLMGGQGALSQATLEIAGATHGVDPEGSVGEAFGNGFVQGIEDFALIAAWGPVRRAFSEHGQIRASHDSAEILRDLNDGTKNSKLFQNAPGEGAKLLNRMGGDKNVYLDLEALDAFAQEKKVSPRELAAGIIGDKGEAYDRAKQQSADLAIPLGNWAEKVVLAGHEEKLSRDARLSLDEMTPRKLAQRMKEITKEVQARADARGPAFEQEVKDLRAQLLSVAKDAGYKKDQGDAFAETLSRHAATMSLRLDVPLREALVRVGLPQLRLEGRDVLGKLGEALKFTPEERASAEGQLPQAAFHGSPYVFDKFLMQHLGSGEGAQVYGHGLYFAESRGVAEFYRDNLTSTRAELPAPAPTNVQETINLAASAFGHQGAEEVLKHARALMMTNVRDAESMVKHLQGTASAESRGKLPMWEGKLAEMRSELEHLNGIKPEDVKLSRGALYKVDVPENSQLLHYDKPLAEQPEAVRAALEKLGFRVSPEGSVKLPNGEIVPAANATGRLIYHSLSEGRGGPVEASRLLDEAGIPGLKYLDQQSRRRGEGTHNFVIWNEKHIQVLERDASLAQEHVQLKMPKDAQEKRGTIRFSVDQAGRAHDFDIRALHGDASTLAHETGHFLSWSLHDLAQRADAPESVRADYAALLKFGGWGDAEARLAENAERSKLAALKNPDEAQALKLRELTAKEEKLSHAWELYLGEGKAPAPALARLFARLRRWMGETYGSLGGISEQYRKTYGEDLWLSDEVRGVFSRLLAVDNEVEMSRAADARLDVGGALHLTPEEVSRRAQFQNQKYEEAREGLDKQTAGHNAENAKGFLRAERERIRADVHDEISATSPYVAIDFFKTGELRNPDTGVIFAPSQIAEVFKGQDGKPLRLSYAEAVKDVGAETAKLLKRKGLLSEKKGGVTGDEVAPLFNFRDGKELLETLAHAPEKDAVVEAQTAQRFEEAFGPKLHEMADALSAAGRDALHNPADIQEALLLRNAIAREIGAPAKRGGKLPHEVLDMNARRIIDGTRLREVSPKYYLDTERRLSGETKDLLSEAFRAKEAGKLEEADRLYGDALHKWDSVVLAKLLWRHARDARNEADAAEAMLQKAAKTSWAARLGQADPSLAYADANATVLASVGFKNSTPSASHIDQVLSAMKRDGSEGVIDDGSGTLQGALWDSQALREMAGAPVAWKDLTLEEARNVRDAVENIAQVARGRNKLRFGERTMEREAFLNALDESSKRLSPTNEPANPKALGILSRSLYKGLSLAQRLDANLTELRPLIERLTGGDRTHPLYQLFVGEREKARDAENRLVDQYGEGIRKLWSDLPKEMRKRSSEVIEGAREALPLPETGGILNPKSPMTRAELWMIALNLGNEGNRQRLFDGYGWSEGQVRAVLEAKLSKAEWAWIQGVWDSLEALYPHIEKTHIADTGLRPEKVRAVPFRVQTPDGEVEMRGGYFPAIYDSRVPSKQFIGEKQEGAALDALMKPLYASAKTVQSHAKARAEKNTDLLKLDFDVVPSHVVQVIHDATHRIFVKQVNGIVLDQRFQEIVRGRLGLAYAEQFSSWVRDVASQYANTGMDTMKTEKGILSWAKSRATLAAVGFNIAVPLADFTNPLLPVLGGDLSALHLARVTRRLATDWSMFRAFALENSIELRARAKHGNSLGIDIPGLVKRKGAMGEVEHAAYWMMEASDRATATPVWLAKYSEVLTKTQDHEAAVRDAEALVQKYFPASDMASRAAVLRDRGLLGSLTFLYGFGSKVYNMNRATILRAYDAWKEPGAGPADKAKAVGTAMMVLALQGAAMAGIGDFLSGHGPKTGQDTSEWAKERALSLVKYQIPYAQLVFSGRGALPSSGLFAKLSKEKLETFEGKNGPAESLVALGSSFVAGAGLNQFLRTAQYVDKGLRSDVRRGRLGHAASGLIYGGRDIVTPLNFGER